MVHLQLFSLLALSLIASVCCAPRKDHTADFEKFKVQHRKTYKQPGEEQKRFQIFSENLDKIDAHNDQFKAGKETFTLAVNQFTDLTADEMIQRKGLKVPAIIEEDKLINRSDTTALVQSTKVPASFDWRSVGAVAPVKYQAQCGSCWAFSAVGVLESYNFLKTKKFVQFSEQDLVDCASTSYSCFGCSGGWPAGAISFVQKSNKIDTESSYPYKAVDGSCVFKASSNGLKILISGVTKPTSGDENALKKIIATVGPTTAVMDASSSKFQNYGGGVFSLSTCGKTMKQMDHAVIIVGYGTDPVGGDYWIVKNSWGSWWGENGYIRIARNKNMCGIALANFYPIIN